MNIRIKLANNSLWAVLACIVLVAFVLFDISKTNNNNTDNLYLRGENAFLTGDYAQAKDLFQENIQKDPNDLLSKIKIADILTKVKRYDESIEYLNTINSAGDIDDTSLNQKLAENYYLKKDYPKAEELIKITLAKNSNNQFLIKLMLDIYLIQERYQDAQTFVSTFDENIFDDNNLFYKRIIQIYNNSLEDSSTTNFDDKTVQNLFIKIENNLADYKTEDKKMFGATNICFELLQFNYFELAKPFAQQIINLNKYMDHGYFYKGLSLLAQDYKAQAQEEFNKAYSIDASEVNNALMVVLTNIALDQTDQIDNSLEQLNKIITESDKYKLSELLKYANDNGKILLAIKLFEKFPTLLDEDMIAVYFKVKFNAINGNYTDLLGDINTLFAQSHYLNDRQKALLLGIKGYIIANETNPIAGKELILQGLELDKYSHFCYYFLAKVNLLQNDKLSYDSNYNKAKEYDLFLELKYE